MTWEYMDELDYRYEKVSAELGSLRGDVVVDLCSGNSKLDIYLKGIYSYLSCDINDDRATFKMTDKAFVENAITGCDILCLFGYGGYEVDSNPLESDTVISSMDYAITNFKPKTVVVESIKKYHHILTELMNTHKEYRISYESISEGDTWLTQRIIKIYKRIK